MYSQVLKAKFALCQYIAQNIKTFSKRSAFYALDGLVDKIGDIKVIQRSSFTLVILFVVFCSVTLSYNLFEWLHANLLEILRFSHNIYFVPQLKDVSKETLTTFALVISLNYISLKVSKKFI